MPLILRICLLFLALVPARALTCSVTTSGVAFGSLSPLAGSATTSSGNVQVQCSTLVALFLSFNVQMSTGSSGSYAMRRMVSGSYTLDYNLHTSSGVGAPVWGTGTGGTDNQTFSALIAIGTFTRNYTVYGRIPSQTTARPGDYADSILITVYY